MVSKATIRHEEKIYSGSLPLEHRSPSQDQLCRMGTYAEVLDDPVSVVCSIIPLHVDQDVSL